MAAAPTEEMLARIMNSKAVLSKQIEAFTAIEDALMLDLDRLRRQLPKDLLAAATRESVSGQRLLADSKRREVAKLAGRRTSLAMIGATAAGKSTLLNGLIGLPLVPPGRGHTTGRVLRLMHGPSVRIELVTQQGRRRPVFEDACDLSSREDREKLAKAVAKYARRPEDVDTSTPEFRRWIAEEVVLYLPLAILELIDLYDLPGHSTDESQPVKDVLENFLRREMPVVVFVYKQTDQIIGEDLRCLELFLGLYNTRDDMPPRKIFFAANGTDLQQYIYNNPDWRGDGDPTPAEVVTFFQQEEQKRYKTMTRGPGLPQDIEFPDHAQDCPFFGAVSALDVTCRDMRTNNLSKPAFEQFRTKLISFAVRSELQLLTDVVCQSLLSGTDVFFEQIYNLGAEHTNEKIKAELLDVRKKLDQLVNKAMASATETATKMMTDARRLLEEKRPELLSLASNHVIYVDEKPAEVRDKNQAAEAMRRWFLPRCIDVIFDGVLSSAKIRLQAEINEALATMSLPQDALGSRWLADALTVVSAVPADLMTGRLAKGEGNINSALGTVFSRAMSRLREAAGNIGGRVAAGIFTLGISELVRWIRKKAPLDASWRCNVASTLLTELEERWDEAGAVTDVEEALTAASKRVTKLVDDEIQRRSNFAELAQAVGRRVIRPRLRQCADELGLVAGRVHAQLNALRGPTPDIDFQDYIGGGGFAQIYGGTWFDSNNVAHRVAFKFRSKDADRVAAEMALCNELCAFRLLERMGCKRVVHLVGSWLFRYDAALHEPVGREYDGTVVVVTERMQSDLASFVSKNPPSTLPPERRLQMARDVVAPVVELHAQHVMHRDIKPENFLVGETGAVVLADPGMSAHDQVACTIGGTPWFMPHEQYEGEYNNKVDVFAVGLVLFAVLLPHPSGPVVPPVFTLEMTRQKIKVHDLAAARKRVPPGSDAAHVQLIMQCLETDPKARPTAEAICAAL